LAVVTTATSPNPRPVVGEPGEQAQIRVSIRVSGAYAHQCDQRMHGVEQLRILVQRAVVSHLQHIGPQVGPVHSGQQVRLFLGLGVSGQQHRHATTDHP
jgi:hypothetical protein